MLGWLKTNKLDALISSHLPTVRFLTGPALHRSGATGTGFTGTNGLIIITKKNRYFVTDSRYTEQAKKQIGGFKIVMADRALYSKLAEIIKQEKIKKLGFFSGELLFGTWEKYQQIFKGVKLVPVNLDSDNLRIIKKPSEIRALTRAHEINKIAFNKIRKFIKPGVTEIAVARRLEQAMLGAGAEKIGFDTIVASGKRGALPHGVASEKKLKPGELVTIDFGCVYQGYYSDETITICLGKPNAKQKLIWQTVYNAQQAAIKIAKPGITGAELDKAARAYITEAGFGQYFAHALGHGVGLEIHERPILSANSTDIIKPGMVFSIEPGIYIPRRNASRLERSREAGFAGGVRIEDVFVCTKTGVKRLSRINKNIF